tara:strand:+ start:249 stop:707 length:459 start_codon:yes stop_codon:yes gene_type:complete
MKNLIAVIIALMALQVNSQELWKNETDDFTGEVIRVTKTYTIAEGVGKLSISVGRINETYFMYVNSTQDLGCAGAVNNSIIFKFTDGTTLKLEDQAKIDCGDNPTSLFQLNLVSLEGKQIEKLRFQMSEYYDDCVWLENSPYNITDFINAVK